MTPEQKALFKEFRLFWNPDLKLLAEEFMEQDILPFPLYHGSNTFALSLTAEQRTAIRNACMVLTPYYFEACKNAGFQRVDDAVFGSNAASVNNAYCVAERFCDGSSNFEYEATYLATSFYNAKGYAERSWFCGELHDAVHWLQVAAEAMKVALPAPTSEQQTAMQLLADCEVSAKPEGVLLRFDNFRKQDLLSSEDGSPINWKFVMGSFLRGMLQYNFRAPADYPLLSGTPIPLTPENIARLDEEEDQRVEALCSDFRKRSFREAKLEQGASLEDILVAISDN